MKNRSRCLCLFCLLFFAGVSFMLPAEEGSPRKSAGSADPNWYKQFLPRNTSNERIPYKNRYGRNGSKRFGVGFRKKNIYPGQVRQECGTGSTNGVVYYPQKRVLRKGCGGVVVRRRNSCGYVVGGKKIYIQRPISTNCGVIYLND